MEILCRHCLIFTGCATPATVLCVESFVTETASSPLWVPMCHAHAESPTRDVKKLNAYPKFSFQPFDGAVVQAAEPEGSLDEEDPDAPFHDFELHLTKGDALHYIAKILSHYPEAGEDNNLSYISGTMTPLRYVFVDGNTDITHIVSEEQFLRAFKALFTIKWPSGFSSPPDSPDSDYWDNWWNELTYEECDGFVQLAVFGEVCHDPPGDTA